ncbi:MAG: EamA family transporter RarD [Gammaproteobacteria bacterium]|nr:EamA family transporter RarD [Gammaproteobacteria bacterium]
MQSYSEHSKGFFSALFSSLFWGITPLYWKALQSIGAMELLAHRVIWSVLILGLLIFLQQNWRATSKIFSSQKSMCIFSCCAFLIATSWYIFIWGVNHNRMIETSLGFFMVPLISVLLGFLFLKERLRRWQVVSIFIATLGVMIRIFEFGQFPWVALILAVTFAFYGLMRKIAPFESIPGLMLETAFLAIPALFYLVYLNWNGIGSLGHSSWSITLLLIGSGFITTLPMLAYAYGAKRIKLATFGLLQFISPSCLFLLGVFLYHEPFSKGMATSFGLIWLSLSIYIIDMLLQGRSKLTRGGFSWKTLYGTDTVS